MVRLKTQEELRVAKAERGTATVEKQNPTSTYEYLFMRRVFGPSPMVQMYEPPLRSQVEKNEALNQINQVGSDLKQRCNELTLSK